MHRRNKIFFDFDGVILASHAVREEGFRDILSDFPASDVDVLIKYHKDNGGLSRYHKIDYFFENILQIPVSKEEKRSRAERFSCIMRKRMISPDLIIQEVVNFIKENHKKYPMHIISGSDQTELRYICREIKIDTYFLSIMGSPAPKIDLIHEELVNWRYKTQDVVYIGDAINDYNAASAQNIAFLGYNNRNLREVGSGYLNNFEEIKAYLE
jgi:phosphoglycolate phosphatase-like HAD superfamily hydrolase